MPITFFKNTGTSFVLANATSGISQHSGWWNSLVSGDFDDDGDVDYVAGNLGLNSNYQATVSEPMTLYAKDLDANGSLDAMLFCYMKGEDGKRKPFPMHTRDDLSSQLVSIRKTYPTYKSYGLAAMDDFWTVKNRQNAIRKTATELRTSYIENKGNGKFGLRALSTVAQASPVYGMMSEDVDGDGNLDLLLVGNDFGMEPYSGRHDAFNGLALKGDGKGSFSEMPLKETGFFVKGDAKGFAKVHTAKGEDIWIATQNLDSIIVHARPAFYTAANAKWITVKGDDFYADITYTDGKRRRVEFYYGSTYLSQSTRKLFIDNGVTKITVTNYRGQKREVL
ncbi:MAG: RNA-binding protein, partial [Chitinophagaceae bacterium]